LIWSNEVHVETLRLLQFPLDDHVMPAALKRLAASDVVGRLGPGRSEHQSCEDEH
jgi:hypothetical protein